MRQWTPLVRTTTINKEMFIHKKTVHCSILGSRKKSWRERVTHVNTTHTQTHNRKVPCPSLNRPTCSQPHASLRLSLPRQYVSPVLWTRVFVCFLPAFRCDQRVKCERKKNNNNNDDANNKEKHTQTHKAITYFWKESFEEFPVLEVDMVKRGGWVRRAEEVEGGTRHENVT